MTRCGPFALATFLSLLPSSALASQGVNRGEAGLIRDNPIQLAELREESIGKQDLASPEPASSPGAVASPAAETNTAPDSNSKSDDWKQVPAGGAAASDDDDDVPAPNAAAVPAAVASPATPAEIAPAIDAGSIATTPNVSDSSLQPLIDTAPTPARAASLRITERQRVEMERGHTDDAVRELAHAISIDPSNSYAYFYLGRAYIARRDYVQAETFFKRAEIGLASNPAWLGETYAFEGVSLEQTGKSADAVVAYQKALVASPGNLTARVGVTRLSAFMPAATTASAPQTNLDQPAPSEPGPPSAPDEAPPPPPPVSAPPPSD